MSNAASPFFDNETFVHKNENAHQLGTHEGLGGKASTEKIKNIDPDCREYGPGAPSGPRRKRTAPPGGEAQRKNIRRKLAKPGSRLALRRQVEQNTSPKHRKHGLNTV